MKGLVSVKLLPLTTGILAVILCRCSSEDIIRQANETVKVKTETVVESNLLSTLDYVGVIEEESSVALSFPSIGTIESIYVSEGEYVKKGQLLAKLDQTSAQNVLDAAESTLKQAQDGYGRLKSIHDNGSLPEIQLIDIETKLQQAQSAYNIASKNLENCVLYAPMDGVVGKKMAEAGESAIIGKTVLTILDINPVKVNISVPENEISTIPIGCSSKINISALGDKEFSGQNIEKGVEANAISHTYPAHISIANPQYELLPGMVCNVEITINENTKSIIVPINIINTSVNRDKYVWCVENGTAMSKPVITGNIKGNSIEITGGLKAGDRVITEGYQKISEGDKISER